MKDRARWTLAAESSSFEKRRELLAEVMKKETEKWQNWNGTITEKNAVLYNRGEVEENFFSLNLVQWGTLGADPEFNGHFKISVDFDGLR